MTEAEATEAVIVGSKEWAALSKSRVKLINYLMGQALKVNPRLSPAMVRAAIAERIDA